MQPKLTSYIFGLQLKPFLHWKLHKYWMPRILYTVCIAYDDFRDFELFLYDNLKYPNHGWTRRSGDFGQLYLLELEEEEIVFITLRYKASTVTPFDRKW